MDDASDDRREPRTGGSDVGDQVGLGRVVEDRRRAKGGRDTSEPAPVGTGVEEASEDSFPASDPPTFMSDAATPASPDRRRSDDPIEAPSPDDVP